jgi:hypothetical protein
VSGEEDTRAALAPQEESRTEAEEGKVLRAPSHHVAPCSCHVAAMGERERERETELQLGTAGEMDGKGGEGHHRASLIFLPLSVVKYRTDSTSH